MPIDPYARILTLLRCTSVVNMHAAVDLINALRHEQTPLDPIPRRMQEVVEAWHVKWEDMGRRAVEHMREGRGLRGHPFGPRPSEDLVQAANRAVPEAIRAIIEGRRLAKGPISDLEGQAFLQSLDSEDALRAFCQGERVRGPGARGAGSLVFWRHGGNDSAVADAYRAGWVDRPWDPTAVDGEAALIGDWVLLHLAHRRGLCKWATLLPQSRRRIGPFLRRRSIRRAQSECRAAVNRFRALGIVQGTDQVIFAGWCTPKGLDLVLTRIRPLWEHLAGLSTASGAPPAP